MKRLGVGLSQTGTTSLHRALRILAFRSLHHDDHRPNDVISGANQNPSFRVYDDVDAVLDIPAACFYDELLEAYPGYLWSHFLYLFQNDRIIAFDLQRYAKEARLHTCTPKGVEV